MSRALQDTHLLVSIYVMLYEFQSLGIYLHYVQSCDEDSSIPSAVTVVPSHVVGAHEHSSRYLSILLYA